MRTHDSASDRQQAHVGLLALALLGLAGCGLGEYEQRMDEEAARLKIYDEENEYLGDPLQMPQSLPSADGKLPPPPDLYRMGVFLRAPKVRINREKQPILPAPTVYMKDEPATSGPVQLYRYTVGSQVGPSLFLAGDLGALQAEKFQAHVMHALRQYAQRVANPNASLPDPVLQRTQKQYPKTATENFPPVDLLGGHADEPPGPTASRFWVYFHRAEGGKQVAVIYQVPLPADEQGVPVPPAEVDWSLKTLAISKAAADSEKAWKGSTRAHLVLAQRK
jgi:hypothetical protein